MSDLTSGPVGGHLRRQTTAFTVGLLAIFSFEAVNLFWISRLGDAPLAAVSFTFPVVWMIYGIGIGFESGAASVISRAIGRRNLTQARRLTTDSAVLATLVLGMMAIVGLFTIEPVFRALGATPELMPMIIDYMKVWYWVAPSDACFWTCLAAVRARGMAQIEARMIMLAALLNVVLDPIFIFGWLGFPRLEVQGAALANLVSNLTVMLFSLVYLGRKLRMFANPIAPMRVVFESWRHMLSIGVPSIVTQTVIPASSAIVVSMIAVYGVDAVAGFGVAARMEPFALVVFYSLSAVSSPFFGQNFGARQFDRLFEARRLILRFCLLYGLALTITMDLVARPLSALFSESETIREVAVHYFWLVSWGYGAHGLVMSVNSAFNGTGRPLPGVVISVCRVIVLFLPLVLLGRWLFGLEGIFAAAAVCNVVLAVVAWFWLGSHISVAARTSALPGSDPEFNPPPVPDQPRSPPPNP